MISWNFPGNQDGQVKGVADAGIENFNGSQLIAQQYTTASVINMELIACGAQEIFVVNVQS